jgi:hypothetical protein
LNLRRSERQILDGDVFLRRPGQLGYPVRIYDASQHGCSVEFVERPALAELLWVKFAAFSRSRRKYAGSRASAPG